MIDLANTATDIR